MLFPIHINNLDRNENSWKWWNITNILPNRIQLVKTLVDHSTEARQKKKKSLLYFKWPTSFFLSSLDGNCQFSLHFRTAEPVPPVSCSYEKLSRRLPGLINLPFHPDTSRSSDGEFNQQIRWTSKPSAFVSLAYD